MIGASGDLNLKLESPDLQSSPCTADVTLNYEAEVDGTPAKITETGKLCVDIDGFSAAVDKVIEKLWQEIDSSEATVFSEPSALQNELSKLLAAILNSLLSVKADGDITFADVLNDAYLVQLRGNETTEIVKKTFGEDLTPETMYEKRLEWNKKFTDETVINNALDSVLSATDALVSHRRYPFLSEVLETPFTEDGSSMIKTADVAVTDKNGETDLDTQNVTPLLPLIEELLNLTDFEALRSHFVSYQSLLKFITASALKPAMEKLAELQLAMIENYGEQEDLYFSFDAAVEKEPQETESEAGSESESEPESKPEDISEPEEDPGSEEQSEPEQVSEPEDIASEQESRPEKSQPDESSRNEQSSSKAAQSGSNPNTGAALPLRAFTVLTVMAAAVRKRSK